MARDSLPTPPSWLVEMIIGVLRHASIRAALVEAVAEALPAQGERSGLLTSDQLCEALRISRSKLDGLVVAGLPHVMVGSARRFQLDEVVAHLRAREQVRAA